MRGRRGRRKRRKKGEDGQKGEVRATLILVVQGRDEEECRHTSTSI